MNFFKNWYSEHKGYEIRPYADRILNKELPKAFDKKDVVRHPIVIKILEAFEKHEKTE